MQVRLNKRNIRRIIFSVLLITVSVLVISAIPSCDTRGWERTGRSRTPVGVWVHLACYTGDSESVSVPIGVTGLNNLSDTVRHVHISSMVSVIMSSESSGLTSAKNLERVTVAWFNTGGHFARNGVLYRRESLFTHILRYYPIQRRSRTYTVRRGTVDILDFANHHIREINLPNSLQSISYIRANRLETLKLPDSLKEIGEIHSERLQSLHIPRMVGRIGRLNIPGEITLSEDNEHFSVSEGVIFDWSKSELIYYPPGLKDEVFTVPESVVRLGEGVFEDNRHLKILRLPAHFQDFEEWCADVIPNHIRVEWY